MPRLQMFVIVLLTGAAGFVASVTMLHLDISQMWIRHPIAVLIAYGVFLLLLRLWLWSHGREARCDLDDLDVDLELPVDLIETEVRSAESLHYAGSGDFCAGSAGASGNSAASGFDLDFDLDDLGFLIIVLLVLIVVLSPVLYLIYIAPLLLAEILIDGVLLVGLYKRVRKVDHPHWLRAAFRRTAIPALVVAVLFSIAGFAMQKAVPAAHSIGDVWRFIT